MNNNLMKNSLAVLAGVVLGGMVVAATEWGGSQLFPMPAGIDPMDPESLRADLDRMGPEHFIPVLVAHLLGALVGGLTAARIAGSRHLSIALIVGGIFLVFGVINLASIPHPLWFSIVDVLVYLPAAYLGGRLGMPRPPQP